MPASHHLLLELDEQSCRRLLGTAVLGRLAFTERALPMITPVHYTLRGNDIVLSSLSDSKVDSARRGAVVAFEVDDCDPGTREGWTVSVIGPSRLITDPAEVRALDDLDFAPWTDHPERAYVAVSVSLLKGHRVVRSATREAELAAAGLGPEA